MKKIVYILAMGLSLISCEEEKALKLEAFSDVSFICSQIQDQYSSNIIEVDTPVSFMDLSQGTVSHQWRIEEGACFIRGEFDIELEESFDQYIIDGAGLTSSDITTFVLFKEPKNESKVSLYNSFYDEVSYYAMPDGTTLTYPFETSIGSTYNEITGLWDFQAHFTFKVIDKVEATVEVFCNDELICTVDEGVVGDVNYADEWDKYEINIGDIVTFKARVYGQPDTVTWQLAGSLYALESAAASSEIISTDPLITEYTATYFPTQLGDVVVGSLSMARSAGTLSNVPTSSLNKVLPMKFKVNGGEGESLPQPSIQVDDLDCITLYFTSLLATLPSDVVSQFTIQAKKESGDSIGIGITAVELSSNATAITLTLSDYIYSNDEITIVYDGGDNPIKDRTGGSLADFTVGPKRLQFFDNVVSDTSKYGFEGDQSNDKNIDGWFIYTWPQWSFSEEKVHTGIRSLKFEISENASSDVKGAEGTLLPGDAGDYIVEAYVYIEEGDGAITNDMYFSMSIASNGFYQPKVSDPSFADIEPGVWTKVKYKFTSLVPIVSTSKIIFWMPLDNVGTIYIDDVSVYKNIERE